jgi:O-antigen/teichoic acid export membrane protein
MTESKTTPQEKDDELRRSVYKGTSWLLAGTLSQRLIRLASNLVLTRVLFPEDFGLAALVFAWVQGMVLCSDLGVMRSIIQHPKGASKEFLGTAFTLQLVRAFGLCLIGVLLAPVMASFFEMPALRLMLPVASLTVLINACSSPRAILLVRDMDLRKTEGITLATALSGILFTLTLAILWGNAWALIVGGLLRDIFRCLLSYLVCPSRGVWLSWNKEAVKEIMVFGRWIVLSSFFAFMALQADRFIAAKFVSMAVLGHLSIALLYIGILRGVISQANGKILLPVFSRTEGSMPERLRPRLRRARFLVLCGILPVLFTMALFGPEIIGFLYEDRWASVGFYLQCAAVGFLPSCLLTGLSVALLSTGDSKGNALVTGMEVTSQAAFMLIGVLTNGLPGMLVARGLSSFVSYPFLAVRLRRRGLWMPGFDLSVLILSVIILCLGFYLRSTLSS